MAFTINAKGTSASSFMIGKKGTTLYQGQAVDPNGISEGNFWFDSLTGALRYKGVDPGSWKNLVFDDITFSNSSIFSINNNSNINLTSDIILTPASGDVYVGSSKVYTEADSGSIDAGSLNGVNSTNFARLDTTTQQTFNSNIVVDGDLTVNGNTDVVQRDIATGENTILLNADWPTGTAPTEGAGIFVYRGNTGETTVGIAWDESLGKWSFQERSGVDPSDPDFPASGGGTLVASYNIWNTNNFDPTSKLDITGKAADSNLLDGIDSTSFVQTTRTISTGTGLSGGGNLSLNRTLSLDTSYTDGRYLGIAGKALDSDRLDGLDSSSFIRTTGGTMSGTLNLGYGGTGGITWENGNHNITNNDGGGNFNFRIANVYSGGHKATVANSTPFHQMWSDDLNGTGSHSFNVSNISDLTVGDTVTFNTQILYDKSIVRLHYAGTKRIETTNAGATVTGAITADSFDAISSIRYKTNVEDLDYTEEFMKLRPVSYVRKETGKNEIGFIAEEVNELIPEVVHKLDNVVEGIDYSRLTAVLTAKVQEQAEQIAELEDKIGRILNLLAKSS